MPNKSEMMVKNVGKINFLEMTMLFAAELTLTKYIAEYRLKKRLSLA